MLVLHNKTLLFTLVSVSFSEYISVQKPELYIRAYGLLISARAKGVKIPRKSWGGHASNTNCRSYTLVTDITGNNQKPVSNRFGWDGTWGKIT